MPIAASAGPTSSAGPGMQAVRPCALEPADEVVVVHDRQLGGIRRGRRTWSRGTRRTSRRSTGRAGAAARRRRPSTAGEPVGRRRSAERSSRRRRPGRAGARAGAPTPPGGSRLSACRKTSTSPPAAAAPGVALGGAAARDRHTRGARGCRGRDPDGGVAGAAVDDDHLVGLGDVQQRADLPGLVERRHDRPTRSDRARERLGQRAVGPPQREQALDDAALPSARLIGSAADEEVRAASAMSATEWVPVDAVGRVTVSSGATSAVESARPVGAAATRDERADGDRRRHRRGARARRRPRRDWPPSRSSRPAPRRRRRPRRGCRPARAARSRRRAARSCTPGVALSSEDCRVTPSRPASSAQGRRDARRRTAWRW